MYQISKYNYQYLCIILSFNKNYLMKSMTSKITESVSNRNLYEQRPLDCIAFELFYLVKNIHRTERVEFCTIQCENRTIRNINTTTSLWSFRSHRNIFFYALRQSPRILFRRSTI